MWDCGAVARRDNTAVCMTALIIFFFNKKKFDRVLAAFCMVFEQGATQNLAVVVGSRARLLLLQNKA